MSIDIHYFIEKQHNGLWRHLPEFNDFYKGRNYDLFAMFGYGHYRDDNSDITPIVEIRGLPKDISKSMMAEAIANEDEENFETQFNYFTLLELDNYNWNATYTDRDGEITNYHEGAEGFLEDTMPTLINLAAGDPASIRIITYLAR